MESTVLDRMNTPTSEVGVSLVDVKVDYPIYDSNAQVMQRRLLNLVSFGQVHRHPGNVHVVHALKDISFELCAGSSVGLIGRNGAGKSTLLKVLAGVLEPTDGTITRRGSITALLTMGSGMENDLDGYQNIRRIGLLRGFTPAEIETLTPDIVAFAELGEFISRPVRTYSAGMRMRLAFSIATVGTPDVLVIDEVFGAGDRQFLTKARERISKLLERSKSLVFASHSLDHIRNFCTSCIYLEHGAIRAHGPTEDVLKFYQQDLKSASAG